MKTLKIEMVHDLVCSWCPIGYANLTQAVANLDLEVDIHFLPSELNPGMGDEGEDINEHLVRRYGWSEARRQDYRENLLAVAEQAGVVMDFSKRTHYYNTGKAHQLMHWAEGYNQQQALNELLIDAYFKRGLDISKPAVLLDLVEQLGLDRSQAEQALTSDEVTQQLRLKQQRVQQLGLSSVPAFIFNEHTLVTGSNSVEYFEQALTSDEVTQQLRLKQQRVQQLGLSSVPAFIFNEHTLVTGSNSVEYFEQAIQDLAKTMQPKANVAN